MGISSIHCSDLLEVFLFQTCHMDQANIDSLEKDGRLEFAEFAREYKNSEWIRLKEHDQIKDIGKPAPFLRGFWKVLCESAKVDQSGSSDKSIDTQTELDHCTQNYFDLLANYLADQWMSDNVSMNSSIRPRIQMENRHGESMEAVDVTATLSGPLNIPFQSMKEEIWKGVIAEGIQKILPGMTDERKVLKIADDGSVLMGTKRTTTVPAKDNHFIKEGDFHTERIEFKSWISLETHGENEFSIIEVLVSDAEEVALLAKEGLPISQNPYGAMRVEYRVTQDQGRFTIQTTYQGNPDVPELPKLIVLGQGARVVKNTMLQGLEESVHAMATNTLKEQLTEKTK